MSSSATLAIDAMGGDAGPVISVAGAAISLTRHPDARFILVGDEARIGPVLAQHAALAAVSRIIHTPIAIAMDAKPSQALREGRTLSSMWLALDCVKRGEASAAISAGNTGALMVMARFCLKTLPGIDRPAIAAVWPTIHGETVVLDVGANVGADAAALMDYAGMGAGLARALFGMARPRVGLLNIGVEEVKGLDEIKRAGAALRAATDLPIEYAGFIEGDDIGRGVVDVVVTEGFSGNIALKAAEGTARQVGAYLKAAMSRTVMSRIGALFAAGAFRALKDKMDPRALNGGLFVGLKGIVIKSHGGTDAFGFASAVDLGYDMARRELVAGVARDVQLFQAALAALPAQRSLAVVKQGS